MNKRDIVRWYREHGMEYVREDWGPRDPETGESAGQARQSGRDLSHRKEVTWPFMRNSNASGALWPTRSEDERARIEALDVFFTPYFARLPIAKVNLIMDYLGWRKTQTEIGEAIGVSQQAVSKEVRQAIRALTRLVAEDDPDFSPPEDGRRRSDDAEEEAAARVLNRWWFNEFGYDRI